MPITKKMLLHNWMLILLIMLVSFITISFTIIVSGKFLTEEIIATFYNFNIEEKKKSLKIEVNNRIDEIKYERDILLTNEKIKIRNNIDTTYNNLIEITQDNSSSSNLNIIKVLEELVRNDGFSYFVLSTKGELIYSSTDNNLVGKNFFDLHDKEGIYFIQDILKAVEKKEGIYTEYFWPKVKNGPLLKKISYCRYLPEFNIIIGTGFYFEDINQTLKDLICKRFQSYYDNKENYIFINSFDSTALVASRKDLVGTKISDLVDYNGQSIHNKIMFLVNTQKEGFIQYKFINTNSNQTSEKISYVSNLEEWDAYIGTGFYIDELNNEIFKFNQHFKSYFYSEALFTIIGLILISLIIFALVQRGAYMQKLYLEQDDIIFEKLFELSGQAIAVISSYGELIYQNKHAIQIFEDNLKSYISNGQLKLHEIEKNIYTINLKNRTYYIKYKSEKSIFKGYDSSIFIFEDISSEYLQTHKLEQMALLDALTKLPNRYALEQDFNILISDENNKYILGILDIDHFKSVNDTYGHNVGDEILKLLADVFKNRLRHEDKIYRYGGEEFVILISNVSLTTAKKVIEDMNLIFSYITNEKYGFKKTYSCGLVELTINKNTSLQYYIQNADSLLYKAKENGRNRIEIKT